MRHPPRPQLPPPPRRAKERGQWILRPVWRDLPSPAGRGRDWRGRKEANRLRNKDDGQPVSPMEREREKSRWGPLHLLSPTGWGEFHGRGLELGAPPFTLGRRGVGWGLSFAQRWGSVCSSSSAYTCGRTGGLPRRIEDSWPPSPEGRYPGGLGVVTFLPGKEKNRSGERYYEVGPKDLSIH